MIIFYYHIFLFIITLLWEGVIYKIILNESKIIIKNVIIEIPVALYLSISMPYSDFNG